MRPRRWRSSGMCERPGIAALTHASAVTSWPAMPDRARRDGAESCERLDELGLSVAFDAGDAENLSRPDGKVTPSTTRVLREPMTTGR